MGNDPRFIECRHSAGGTTTREAEVAHVAGQALLGGPTCFPVWAPVRHEGERRIWRRGTWWIIVRRARR